MAFSVVLFLISCAYIFAVTTACPFYQLIPTNVSDTTNYTSLNEAITAAKTNNAPVMVCDGAVVTANETIDTIDQGVHIIGDAPPGKRKAYLTFETESDDFVFTIDAGNGDLVVFENINIVYDNYLFLVKGQSQLTLTNFTCWFGLKCVTVVADTTGVIPPGLVIESSAFMMNAYAIFHSSGHIRCTHCSFYDSLTGAVITNNTAQNPFSFINMYDHHYINVLFPIGVQGLSTSVISAPTFSDEYVDSTRFFNSQTYFDPTSGAFGSDSGGGTATLPPCEKCECDTTWLLVIIFSIAFFALAIYVCRAIGKKARSHNTK